MRTIKQPKPRTRKQLRLTVGSAFETVDNLVWEITGYDSLALAEGNVSVRSLNGVNQKGYWDTMFEPYIRVVYSQKEVAAFNLYCALTGKQPALAIFLHERGLLKSQKKVLTWSHNSL